jgi:Bacterial TniB protein
MTLDLSHLAASVKEEAFHDAPSRIRLVQTARWVEFARGRLALEELERRFQYPSCARMPCMLLYGDSGMGKTMLIEKMERQHPNSHHERRGLTLRPVLRVQMPASPDERRFYTRLLEILGAPYTSHDQIGALEAPFGEAAMIRTLLELSGGITGKVTALLARAAEAAILDGSEHIDPVALVKHRKQLRSAAA